MYLSSVKCTVSTNALYWLKQSSVQFEGLLVIEVCRVNSTTGIQASLVSMLQKKWTGLKKIIGSKITTYIPIPCKDIFHATKSTDSPEKREVYCS